MNDFQAYFEDGPPSSPPASALNHDINAAQSNQAEEPAQNAGNNGGDHNVNFNFGDGLGLGLDLDDVTGDGHGTTAAANGSGGSANGGANGNANGDGVNDRTGGGDNGGNGGNGGVDNPNGNGNGNDSNDDDGDAREPIPPDQIELVVKDTDGQHLYFRIKRKTPFKRLFLAYASRVGKDVDTLRFLYDGHKLKTSDTPESEDMENSDIIEAFLEQIGGA